MPRKGTKCGDLKILNDEQIKSIHNSTIRILETTGVRVLNKEALEIYHNNGCDVHIHNGAFISRFPLIPGHEFAGVVEKTGAKVTAFKKGDRVIGDNTVLCGECYYCRKDQPLYCENFYSLGVNGPGGVC